MLACTVRGTLFRSADRPGLPPLPAAPSSVRSPTPSLPQDLYRGQTDNPMVVPKCSRSGDIIEPLSVPQWFCNCDSMAKRATEAVRNGGLGWAKGVGRKRGKVCVCDCVIVIV